MAAIVVYGERCAFEERGADVVVPDLVGLTAVGAGYASGPALRALESAGLEGELVVKYSGSVPAGSVIRQSPPAGSLVQAGDSVEIIVSLGKAPRVRVPGLRGFTDETAERALEDVGLAVGSVTETPNTKVGTGKVIRTDPAHGTRVPVGSAVDLQVSTGPSRVAKVNNASPRSPSRMTPSIRKMHWQGWRHSARCGGRPLTRAGAGSPWRRSSASTPCPARREPRTASSASR